MTPDEAIAEFRKLTEEQFYRRLADDPTFKAAFETAYARDPSFMTVDAAGWHPFQYNVAIPPVQPISYDPFGPGAPSDQVEKYKRHPGDPYPAY